jgi:transcriptional regulator NrdR family protein
MCPECGAVRGRCLQTGYDDQDRVIRQRECGTCTHRYATVEVAVPDTTFFHLADSRRLAKTYYNRLARGFHNSRAGRYRRQRDRVEVQVTVLKARAAA